MLWAGQSVTRLGTELSGLAIPVLAVQLLGADELEMGLLGAADTAAFLVLGLPAGAWVDRLRKRRVMTVTDLLRGVALASLPAAWVLGILSFWHLLAVTLIVGAGAVFFDISYQSILPTLVRKDQIVEANAKLEMSTSISMVGGPAVGGQLLRIMSAPFVIALDALSFLLSALFLSRIRTPDLAPDKSTRRNLRVEVAEGMSFVLRQPLLRRIVACTAISNLFSSATGALIVLYALRDLQLSAGTLGLVFSLGAVGALLGAVTTTPFTKGVGEGRAIPIAALSFVPSAALIPLAGTLLPPAPTLIASWFLTTVSIVLYNVTQVSFRQRLCPTELLGRMNASVRFIVWGTMPIGSLLGGLVAQQWGIRAVLWAAVFGQMMAALPVLLSPLVRMRDLPTALKAG
ncbi:MFS transporter [Cellulomonas carbonis]|uniref:MFS transporter n=1 Tax=Cellulomonas carbonis TaxID=1386092 RepID=UPI00166D1D1F|nr:MFS transporter [Cellulomonas carbonis]